MPEIIFPDQPETAGPMAAYMKNLFPFAGVKKPQRQKLTKALLQESLQWEFAELRQAVFCCYAKDQREYQYLAIDLVGRNYRRLTLSQLAKFVPLLREKQWWDSIDAWRKIFGDFVKLHPKELPEVFGWFYQDADFWLRRVSINLQLQLKSATDLALLTKAITFDRKTEEFFIQKAIGWSLREYSKTDPDWVRRFLAEKELSKLAVREASKYL